MEELQKIETAEVDALVEIRKEQQLLDGLIEKANAGKGKVPDAVFERVMKDYDSRRRAAEDKARPLRQKARANLATLASLHSRLKAELDAAQLDQSELQFRHEIGELSDADFESKKKGAEETLVARHKDFADADALRQRFLDVLPAEPEPPLPPPVSKPAEAAAGLTLNRTGARKAEPTPEFATVALPLPTAAPAAPDFGTVVLSREEAAAAAAGAAPDFGTIVAPTASLTREEPDGSTGPTYRLGLVVTIGRTPDNEIPIELPEVSRRHARLSFGDNGFTIKDLNSNNGTFVNGERVPEARLREGDRVQVGPAVFLFSEK